MSRSLLSCTRPISIPTIWVDYVYGVIKCIAISIEVCGVSALQERYGVYAQEQVPLTGAVVNNRKNSKRYNMLACTLW